MTVSWSTSVPNCRKFPHFPDIWRGVTQRRSAAAGVGGDISVNLSHVEKRTSTKSQITWTALEYLFWGEEDAHIPKMRGGLTRLFGEPASCCS